MPVWTGEGYFVAWNQGLAVDAMMVDRDGRPLDAAPKRVGGSLHRGGAVAFAGGAWIATTLTSRIALYLFDSVGNPVGSAISVLESDKASDAFPVLATNGTAALLVWNHWNDNHERFVAIAPASIDEPIRPRYLLPASGRPAIAANGRDFLLVFRDDAGNLVSRQLDAQGQPFAGDVVAKAPGFDKEEEPAISAYGDGYLVVTRGTFPYFSSPSFRIDRDGRTRMRAPFLTDGQIDDEVALGTNGRETLAAWADGRYG